MKIKFFCPLWGMEALTLKDALFKIKEAGYDGVEMGYPALEEEREVLRVILKEQNLELIAQQYAAIGNTFEEYTHDFEKKLYNLASLNPLFINSHTGKDYYSFSQNKLLIEKSAEISKETGIKIIHEIHRGRFTFSTANIGLYFQALGDLKITADFSHWCNVSESYLQDQKDIVTEAIKRSEHIHARVGHPQGPQVSDPRAPEWKEAVQYHLNWWDDIIEQQKQKGVNLFTITPEFGPEPYLPVQPFTKQPVASQWDINCYIKDLLKERYSVI